MSKTQFNIRIPKSAAASVRRDARDAGMTNPIIILTALENWFSSRTKDERKRFYLACKVKPYARSK